MPDLVETLPDTAAPGEGQPASVVQADSTEPQIAPESAAPATAVPTEPVPAVTPGRRYAGKYETDSELEKGYLSAQAENTRMAQELSRLRGVEEGRQQQVTQPQDPTAKYSVDQLEQFKEGHLLNLAKYQSDGDSIKAAESAAAIRVIDGALRKREVQGITQQFEQRGAYEELRREVTPILDQYRTELVPGTDLYERANGIYQKALRAGLPPGEVTASNAVILALHGQTSKGAMAQARRELTTNISTSLRQGVVAGAGQAASVAPNTPDLMKMSDAEFIKWKDQNGLGDERR